MQKFLWGFLWLIAIYHIIVTVLWYGIIWWESQAIISIARDMLWLIFVLVIFFWNFKKVKDYLKKWKNVRIRFVVLILFSLWISFLAWQSISNIMIWIKYDFFYLLIFLTASFVWFVWFKKLNKKQINWFQYFLMWILIFGFLWQIMKIIKPEIFMNIWYWKFDDFYFGANPPIYYLTGFEWTTRWQWLFSWPNNYGYFLIAFLPVILLWRWNWLKKIKYIIKNPFKNLNILFVILRILAIALTLSRAAIIATILIFILLAKDWIKKNKKVSMWILIILILLIAWLSMLKYESTIWHVKAKLWYVWEIIDNPLWHWLGSSWPAIHHEWTMLPENYFMQVMLDIGTVWFIIWAIVIFQILLIFKNIKLEFDKWNRSAEEEMALLHWQKLYMWRSLLLFIGLFLHVFEDSMVNYIFFIVFGLMSGYLSTLYKKNTIDFKELFLKK